MAKWLGACWDPLAIYVCKQGVYMHTHAHGYTHAAMRVCVHLHMCTQCVYCAHKNLYLHVYAYVHMCVCLYACTQGLWYDVCFFF